MKLLAVAALAIVAVVWPTIARAAEPTTYTLPSNLHWRSVTPKGSSSSYLAAVIRGKYDDACDNIIRVKFPNGYVYPWHTNGNTYAIYTILQGTLVIGFDKKHAGSAERALPAGSVMQGLGSEPHYGRAVGETIFDVYTPCRR